MLGWNFLPALSSVAAPKLVRGKFEKVKKQYCLHLPEVSSLNYPLLQMEKKEKDLRIKL